MSRFKSFIFKPALMPGFTAAAAVLLAVAVPQWPIDAQAAEPPSGSISANGPTVNWVGTATGGASEGEDTCVEGVNCDTFTLNVTGSASDYAGKLIQVTIQWNIPTNDYDLYIHKGSNTGPIVGQSGQGAPSTQEQTAIDPSKYGTGAYTVHVVYFSVAPGDEFQGTAAIIDQPEGRRANYAKGHMEFSANYTVKAPATVRDGEPSSRTDKFGNFYVSGIRGVPAGVDLWYFDLRPNSPTYDPYMRNPIYRGQPDSFTPEESTEVGADGGGDVDLAVGFGRPAPGKPPILAFSSLVAANISVGNSTDRGENFTLNPLGNVTGGAPGDDRQWLEFYGDKTVYLFYRTLEPAVSMVQRSIDGGLSFGPATTAGTIGQAGYIDVNQDNGDVYISGSTGQVCVGVPPAPDVAPITYTCNQAASDPNGVAHIFFPVKIAEDGTKYGTAYVAYSNDKDIFLVSSQDRGQHWSKPVRVSNGPLTNTSVLPWLETGPTEGSVGVVWYGTPSTTNGDSADWRVFYAQTSDATADVPTFRQTVASDHIIHASNISEGGLTGSANRNLLDYFQVSFDPTGAAVIAYTDDHNDFDGATYVTRQIGGRSISGQKLHKPKEGAELPPPEPLSDDGSQVTDFAQDVTTGLLVVTPTNSPLDITSIKYSAEESAAGPVIVARMKVSDLSVIPPEANWRMNFTANAPHSELSPTGQYTFGVSDRGDQFFVEASTDATGVQSFTYGTAVRESDGSITYTTRGEADAGAFDPETNTITVKVSAEKLNPFVTHGDPIGDGSILVGLRGSAFTSGVNAQSDDTRGGTQFAIGGSTPGHGPK
ncbi:MAG TPA: hypothetical protein VFH57_01010 [Gammaproteobacteria bacterium]|nr:hypothetical protein [Gammaproteobacteria bacterium]